MLLTSLRSAKHGSTLGGGRLERLIINLNMEMKFLLLHESTQHSLAEEKNNVRFSCIVKWRPTRFNPGSLPVYIFADFGPYFLAENPPIVICQPHLPEPSCNLHKN